MDEVKEQIKHVISIHRNNFKNEKRVTRKIFDILDEEAIEELQEDIYTIEESDYAVKHCKNGKLHRSGGEPAVIYKSGDKHWYENGCLHRLDGPASDYDGGWKIYFVNGKYIRTDKS